MNFIDKLNVQIGLVIGAETFQQLTTKHPFDDWLNVIDWNQLKVEFPKELVKQKVSQGIDDNTLTDLVKTIDQYYFDQYKKVEHLHFQQVAQQNEKEMLKHL